MHTGWRKGKRYVKTERLKASLDELLLHEGGSKTNLCAWSVDQTPAHLRQPPAEEVAPEA